MIFSKVQALTMIAVLSGTDGRRVRDWASAAFQPVGIPVSTPKRQSQVAMDDTKMDVPWFTKQGIEKWMQIDKEENEKRRKLVAEGKITGFDKVRYGLVAPLPGYFRRGFYQAWDGDEDDTPMPDAFEGAEPRKTLGFFRVFAGSDDNIAQGPPLKTHTSMKKEAANVAPPKQK